VSRVKAEPSGLVGTALVNEYFKTYVLQRRRHSCRRALYTVYMHTCMRVKHSYLVDPASSHMLVSKIKPCMSKYKHLYCETANGSLNQLSFI
jgi:hypothetical protein